MVICLQSSLGTGSTLVLEHNHTAQYFSLANINATCHAHNFVFAHRLLFVGGLPVCSLQLILSMGITELCCVGSTPLMIANKLTATSMVATTLVVENALAGKAGGSW